jgi:spore maturation protein CgeB
MSGMHFVIFGLSISSTWGNGHATHWRGLLKAMARRGHTVAFYEKDLPYYARARDEWEIPPSVSLHLYDSWDSIQPEAKRDLARADVGLCTSYCPDGGAASRLILDSRATVRGFYDLDTPVTLDAIEAGEAVPYLPPDGLADFDIVLSYTGGRALKELRSRLGARAVAALYGSVDPSIHRPVAAKQELRAALSYLGTYAADRQAALAELFVQPARKAPQRRFVLAGAQYPADFSWTANIFFLQHLPPSVHSALFCSSRATLNVTRQAMARYGYCPSGRLFEAAACGTPILSDEWEGLDAFFTPKEEIYCVGSADDVLAALELSDMEIARVAEAARSRTLQEHTAEHRIAELEAICNQTTRSKSQLARTA